MISEENIKNVLCGFGIEYGNVEFDKMMAFLDLVAEQNRKSNLTGTRDKEDILKRHFFDCLAGYRYFFSNPENNTSKTSVLDIGTGGGLPGILLAIFVKNSSFYLMDAKKKNTDFLKKAIEVLELKNAFTLNGRAEEIAHYPEYREKFDISTARAVAKTLLLSELALPFCKIGGRVIFYKSRKAFEELNEAEEKIKMLGGVVEGIYETAVPFLDEYRAMLVIKKVTSTLYKYPRKYVRMIKESKLNKGSFES